jgi:hypothetical protein
MTDPRAANCKAYHVNTSGLVDGVELQYAVLPSAPYELVRVELIDEPTNGVGGPTVAFFEVLTKDGIKTAERVVLAYPWPDCTNRMMPGTPGEHMITNGYNPPDIGPLALYPVDASGRTIGDLIGGLGLPYKHHVSYRLTWKERGTTPTPPPTPDPGTGDNADVLAKLESLEARIDALSVFLHKHFKD